MWLFTNFGFFSVVQKPGDAILTIRARVRADLDRLRSGYLPQLGETRAGEGTDYPYRASASHAEVAAAMARIAEDIDYSNFKSKVSKTQGQRRSHAYMAVWDALYDLENNLGAGA